MIKENDVRIDTSLLHPNLRYKLNKLLKTCNNVGIYLIITEGFRTKERQDELYAQGRTKPGNIVTNARGCDFNSQHQWGIAFDIAIRYVDNPYDVNIIKKVADIAKDKPINLSWGGDWTDFRDYPHFYLGNWGSNTRMLKNNYILFSTFQKTWSGKVRRKRGLNIWSTYKIKGRKRKIKLDYNTKVSILWKHTKWAKVRYKGIIGYMRSKYLK